MTKTDFTTVLSNLKAQCAEAVSAPVCMLEGEGRCWLAHDHKTVVPVGANQITSLNALIAYVAHMTGRHELRVEREFVNRFCIPNVKCLPAKDYDKALCYLADQVPPENQKATA